MYPLRFEGGWTGSVDQNVVPLERTRSQGGRRRDEKSVQAIGHISVHNIFVSREKCQPKRQQKFNRLDEQFKNLLAEALVLAAD